MNLLAEELPWLDQLREYYCAQLIGHMLADPTKARKIPEALPLTMGQIEAANRVNRFVEARRVEPATEWQQYMQAREPSNIANFWPDYGFPQKLEPWDKIQEHIPLLLVLIEVYSTIGGIDEDARVLRLEGVKTRLKQALRAFDGHLIGKQ